MNIGKFLSGDYDFVQKDIEAVVAEAKPKGVLVKVILETCYLSPEQVALMPLPESSRKRVEPGGSSKRNSSRPPPMAVLPSCSLLMISASNCSGCRTSPASTSRSTSRETASLTAPHLI